MSKIIRTWKYGRLGPLGPLHLAIVTLDDKGVANIVVDRNAFFSAKQLRRISEKLAELADAAQDAARVAARTRASFEEDES